MNCRHLRQESSSCVNVHHEVVPRSERGREEKGRVHCKRKEV